MIDETDNFEAARPGNLDDIDLLVSIAQTHAESIAGTRGADLLLRRELALTADELAQSLRNAVDDSEARLVVGTFADVVFGFGHVRYETLVDGAVVARLEQLVVDPEARGVGIGEAIMNVLIEEANRRGCIGIDSIALPGDRSTKNFFESFGLKARQLVVHLALDAAEPAASVVR